ncbi:MAG: hypothetical protein TEF_09605 [Rhizobiales bacterium NRL2]|nr:MAG: hypothetical protein TEF_09605 [Rhizobiales bacterium NRL2]
MLALHPHDAVAFVRQLADNIVIDRPGFGFAAAISFVVTFPTFPAFIVPVAARFVLTVALPVFASLMVAIFGADATVVALAIGRHYR